MAETKPRQINAAPRPPTPLSESQRRLVEECRERLPGGEIPRAGCGLCGGSVCRCGQADPLEAALQAAGLL